jgi:hypothetical protein
MVKSNTPDWQISAFDKDNNSCVKTKPFNEKIKELEEAYAKAQETSVKVEDIDMPAFYLKEEKDDKVDVLKEYQDMRDRQRKEELEKSRRDENKVVFTSAPRKDPNRGMRFVGCSDPINKGKLGSSRSFIKKKDKEYY